VICPARVHQAPVAFVEPSPSRSPFSFFSRVLFFGMELSSKGRDASRQKTEPALPPPFFWPFFSHRAKITDCPRPRLRAPTERSFPFSGSQSFVSAFLFQGGAEFRPLGPTPFFFPFFFSLADDVRGIRLSPVFFLFFPSCPARGRKGGGSRTRLSGFFFFCRACPGFDKEETP